MSRTTWSSEPTISVKNLKVDLGSYLGIVGDVFGDLTTLFNSGPLGSIVDVATEPVPALDYLAHKAGLVALFDKVGGLTGGGDGVITLGDLAVLQRPALEAILDPWYQAIWLISQIRKIDTLSDSAGEIDFGGGTLVGGKTVSNNNPSEIVTAVPPSSPAAGAGPGRWATLGTALPPGPIH